MNLKLTALIIAFLFALTVFPSLANGWVVDTHDYMCPQNYTIDCKIADYAEIHNNYPYTTHLSLSHLSLDNKTDGAARLVANYYLKKYYVERQVDNNYLAIAAHFLQDASCPAHW